MTYKLLAIVALLASVALAQPFVNGPLLGRYNYIQPASNAAALVEVTHGFGWAFTATSDGVYGMNTSLPSYNAVDVQFFDALKGVTQLFATGPWTVIAIANSSIVLYEFNQTTAWRAATYWRNELSFDVQQYNNGGGQSLLYPYVQDGVMILGSQLLISSSTSWSMVFAFNTTTLELLWNTTIGWDTTNYAPASFYGDSFVFIQAQDTRGANSNVRVIKLYLNNGTIAGAELNTGSTSFTTIGVTDKQLVVASYWYIDIYDTMTWTKLRDTVSLQWSSSNQLYQPIAINNTWYVVTDRLLYAFDYTTYQQLSWSPKTFSNSVQGGAMRYFNESATTGIFQSNILLMEGCNVWVVNATGLVKLLQFTKLAQSSTSCNPEGALFDWDWSGRFPMIDDIVHLSYTSSNGGTVIALNYTNGEVLGQATGNFNPVGRAKLDLWHGRLYSASSQGGIMQGFAFQRRRMMGNFSDFVAMIPSSESQTSNFGFFHNATNMSSYYIGEDSLFTVDNLGNVAKVAVIVNDAYYVNSNPLLFGEYFVFISSYGGTYYLNVYNAATKAFSSVSVCYVSGSEPIFNVGTVVYATCDSSSRSVVSVDVSKTTLTVVSYGTYYGTGLSADSKHVVFRSSGNLYCYAVGATATPLWKSSGMTLYSPAVLYGDNIFVAGRRYGTGFADTETRLLKIPVTTTTPSASATVVGKLASTDTYQLLIRQNGVFGSAGYVYCIGTTNITAFNMGSNEQEFSFFINTSMYGSVQVQLGSPTVLSTGAMAFYTSNDYFVVAGGFKGGIAWAYKGASSTDFPILTDNRSIYFVKGQQVIGADTYTGAVTSSSSFGTNTMYGYTIAPGINETTVIGANGYAVFAATSPLYMSPAGPNPSFPGQGSNNGGNSLLDEAKSKAWIAGVVIGVLVVIVVVVIIAKKKSAPASGDDYVAMNPATQV